MSSVKFIYSAALLMGFLQLGLCGDKKRNITSNANGISYSATEVQMSHDEKKPKYFFSYSVKDGKTGDQHQHAESREGAAVNGFYNVVEPDGALRTVQYYADEFGFFPVVSRDNFFSMPYHQQIAAGVYPGAGKSFSKDILHSGTEHKPSAIIYAEPTRPRNIYSSLDAKPSYYIPSPHRVSNPYKSLNYAGIMQTPYYYGGIHEPMITAPTLGAPVPISKTVSTVVRQPIYAHVPLLSKAYHHAGHYKPHHHEKSPVAHHGHYSKNYPHVYRQPLFANIENTNSISMMPMFRGAKYLNYVH